MNSQRGFSLLEMIVASTILAIAVVGLMSGLSSTTRNAARLQDYDRAVQLGRYRMNELLLDRRIPRNSVVQGTFDPAMAGNLEAGWRAKVTEFAPPPALLAGATAIDRVELEVWWRSGKNIRTYTLDSYRPRPVTAEDIAEASKK